MTAYIEWEREARPAEGALAARGVAPGLTAHSTGARVSGSLIVELALSALSTRSVNSGVRFLLHGQTQTDALIFISPERQGLLECCSTLNGVSLA